MKRLMKSSLVAGLFATVALLTVGVPLAADTGPFFYGGNTYYVLTSCRSWQAAEDEAAVRGGHLVTIDDAAENDFVESILPWSGGWWIGLSDHESEGTWIWRDGQVASYTNWNLPNEPNGGGGENCVEILRANNPSDPYAGEWNDLPCDRCIGAVIEIAAPPACSDGGPYVNDSATLLLLHFDGDFEGLAGEVPTDATGETFETGKSGLGARLDEADSLN